MKIYISGPISGINHNNKPAFDTMATILRDMGHSVINPHDLDLIDKVHTWTANLRRDIRYLMDCDAVVLLPGWEQSKGARLEVATAYFLEMNFYYCNDRKLFRLPITIDQEITPILSSVAFN